MTLSIMDAVSALALAQLFVFGASSGTLTTYVKLVSTFGLRIPVCINLINFQINYKYRE